MQTIDKNEIVDIKDPKKGDAILKQNGGGKSQSRTHEGNNNDIKKDTTLTQPMGLDPNA